MFYSPTEAFNAYLSIPERMPENLPADSCQTINSITDILSDVDVFLFDAYGVLNVGGTAIEGAKQQIDKLRQAGKVVMVVTNAATQNKQQLFDKFARLGFDFSDQEIVNSREVLLQYMDLESDSRLGVITLPEFRLDIQRPCLYPEDSDFWQADEFLFLSGQAWNETLHQRFITELRRKPRTVWVGNSDLIAPLEDGVSQEPGSYTLTLPAELYNNVRCFGKPYAPIFEEALSRIKRSYGDLDPQRIAMIGDTLHTDILGGNAMGFKTVLVTQHGFLRGLDVAEHIAKSQITPHYQLASI
ncbi:HAD hydrolase-like protein [Agarivorans aestuarii]|uniref:HAD hydrolase-like protein n=1 Tax=Agarivorans aestuarii TaxID=1563703 RepID=A0ABU7G3J3_9ALTE|nr:HAD hydrolase-like protein [Agarivorans aestuarii]MEE1673956.1 HAD hydrolase-like protein [Agarivorans aestuarii]